MKKFFKPIWLSFILPLLITVIGGIFNAKLENINIISGICNFIKLIFNSIIYLLNISIPVWVILTVIIIIIGVIYIIIKINDTGDDKPKWYEEYTTDIYKKIKYSWYYYDNYGDLKIKNFRAVCNQCGGELISKQDGYSYYIENNFCPNCNKLFDKPNESDTQEAFVYVTNKLIKKQKEIINNKNK